MRDFDERTKKQKDSKIFGRLMSYAKPFKWNFIISLILIFVDVAASSISPMILGFIIRIIGMGSLANNQKILLIIAIAIAFLVVFAIILVMTYYQQILLQTAGQRIVAQVRSEVFEHIEQLSLGQIYEVPIGKLVTRVTNDTNTLSEMYTSVVVSLLRNFMLMIVQFVIMIVMNVQATLMMSITIPFVAIFTFAYRYFARNQYRKVRNANTNVNAFLQENLSGIKLTQIFNQEEKKRNEFEQTNKRLRNEQFKELLMFAVYRPLMFVLSMLASLIVVYFVGTQIVNMLESGTITSTDQLIALVSSLIILYTYANDFFRPLQNLSEDFNILQSAFASAEKIFDVLDTKPAITDAEDAIELKDFKGSVEFKNVWFYYVEDVWVLKDVSFKINPNDSVAFVGATGSGKTTIMNLIVRNYDIQKGEILIDGIPIKKIKLDSLRREIGQMPQDVFLFTGSIKSNISFKDESIDDEKIIQASKYVGAHDFITSLPDEYDHVVRERGNNFSTGQRQLLSFARALVYEPTIMILDEATANIDSETEEIIQHSLEKMIKISTMIAVAHRLSTIQKMDKIYVMQKGEIIESGSHQELLALGGVYYSLYELQYK